MRVPLADPTIPREAHELIEQVLRTGRLSYGPKTEQFESLWAKMHRTHHAVFTASGTCALQIALLALKEQRGWQDGDQVIVPAVTFVATANAVRHAGLMPVFVDVHESTWCIDAKQIRVGKRTVCIMPVHLLGLSADMVSIMSIADRHGLAVVEDACQSVLVDALYGKPVGSVGDVGCFSTYASHHVSTGVGGMAITRDDQLCRLMRSYMQHGRDVGAYMSIDDNRQTGNRLSGVVAGRFRFPRIGHSFRTTELEAAIGLAQLIHLSQNVAVRRNIAQRLAATMGKWPIKTPVFSDSASFLFYGMVTQSIGQKQAMVDALEHRGVETRDMFPLVTQGLYKISRKCCPVAYRLAERGFCIGCHPGVTPDCCQHVLKIIGEFCQ